MAKNEKHLSCDSQTEFDYVIDLIHLWSTFIDIVFFWSMLCKFLINPFPKTLCQHVPLCQHPNLIINMNFTVYVQYTYTWNTIIIHRTSFETVITHFHKSETSLNAQRRPMCQDGEDEIFDAYISHQCIQSPANQGIT